MQQDKADEERGNQPTRKWWLKLTPQILSILVDPAKYEEKYPEPSLIVQHSKYESHPDN